ncbi:FtsW/RodA/SpoVE family cell cycle protein [Rugamonas sp.]|uniref:FtsW/RodA/SpoVE family cell cycle protein n=1 Tax=Rugamonas sp. TaxID=1926287 RepID=UPI0025F52CA1|nr:FtsW/RodA/SpoVE family cell cycle protein [Rugamonas sp.]
MMMNLAFRLPPRYAFRAPHSAPTSALYDILRSVYGAARRYSAPTITAIVLALLCALQAWTLWRAPAAWFPSLITIQLKAGETLVLGQRELAAPQADKAHLALRRDADGAWMLRNLSAAKQVVLQYAAGEQRMGSVTLAAGQRFLVENKSFDIESSSAYEISFTQQGRHWRYDGATLYRDGHAQGGCADAHLSARALALWNRAVPRALTVPHALSFGGNVYCDNRLGLEGVTPGSAYLARNDGALRLSAGSPDGDRAALTLQTGAGSNASSVDLRQQELPLAGVSAIIVGHTRFQLDDQGGHLTLAPSRHLALFNVAQQKLPPQIGWQWQQRALWSGAHGGAIWPALAVAMLLILSSTASGPRWQASAALASSTLMLGAGLAALMLQRAGHPPSAACSMALAAGAAYLWLLLPGRWSPIAAAAVVLLATGLLLQLELGLGVNESSWLNYFQKSAALLALGVGAGGCWRLWARRYRAHLGQRGIEWLLALFAAVALGAMAAEVLWGDETGVFDLQPVELAKLALTALTAHALALRFSWHAPQTGAAGMGARWLRLIAPALLFLALLGLALVQVDDFSPLILLLVWSTAMAFAYAIAARNRVLAASLAALVLAAVAGVVYMRCVGTDDLIKWGFYADRFLVWLDPAEHPHTGQQLLLGARAITDGGWWGSDHLLGFSTLGLSAGGAMRIPAVQDDFAAAFFLNRHGLVGALLLWAVQAAFVAAIAQLAARAYSASAAARDFRQARSGRFAYFMLCGGAAFVLGHFLLSWGTNLAIFPIMGQPMSFLSAGGSHLLFFLCPLLAFCAISAQSLEENEPCRSTSNTKS